MVSLHALVLAAAALAGNSDLVLLDFGADWCAPCRSMEPTIQRLQEAGYPVRRINVDQSPDLARQFSVGPIPCFVLAQNGREVQRVVGAASFDRLVQLFQQAGQETAAEPVSGVRGQSPDSLMVAPVPPTNRPRTLADARPLTPPPALSERTAVPPSNPIHQRALQATVRLRVVDATGQSHGTGTIIDTHGGEALILTCGHIFRDSQGQGEILVELFAPGTKGPLPGHLLSYECEKRDFGLVSFRPDVPITPVKVAPTDFQPRAGDPIFSVGCDHAENPTIRVSSISAIDRYSGPPNIEILGHPVEGRSGGGLLTAQGQLIGICNAADLQEDRGIFAALPTIHQALTNIGLQHIYQDLPPTSAASLADGVVPAPATDSVPVLPTSATRHDGPATPRAAAGRNEVICIIRSCDDPEGSGRVMVVKDPSSELLQRLATESQPRNELQRLPSSPAANQETMRLPAVAPPSNPIVRAQGY